MFRPWGILFGPLRQDGITCHSVSLVKSSMEWISRLFPKPASLTIAFDSIADSLGCEKFDTHTVQNQPGSFNSEPSKLPAKPTIGLSELESTNPIAEQLVAFSLRKQFGHGVCNVLLSFDPTCWTNFGSNIPSCEMAGHSAVFSIQRRLNFG